MQSTFHTHNFILARNGYALIKLKVHFTMISIIKIKSFIMKHIFQFISHITGANQRNIIEK